MTDQSLEAIKQQLLTAREEALRLVIDDAREGPRSLDALIRSTYHMLEAISFLKDAQRDNEAYNSPKQPQGQTTIA